MKKHIIKTIILSLLPLSVLANPIIAEEDVADVAAQYNYSLDDNIDSSQCIDLHDPLEKLNRKIFYFNSFLDYIILKPVARSYSKILNDYTKARIGNAIDNIYEPLTTVNYTLQADGDNALKSFWKFVVNSTLGIGGAFDIASKVGIETVPQTFGSTLAYYGVSPGPYLVLPILGSTNMRDMWDVIITDDKLNPVKYGMRTGIKNAYTITRTIHKRSVLLPFTDHITQTSTDPYTAIRSAMHQNREKMLRYPANYHCGYRPYKH